MMFFVVFGQVLVGCMTIGVKRHQSCLERAQEEVTTAHPAPVHKPLEMTTPDSAGAYPVLALPLSFTSPVRFNSFSLEIGRAHV